MNSGAPREGEPMSELIITLLSVSAYFTGWAFGTRLIYGRLRSRSIAYNTKRWPTLYESDPIDHWNHRDRSQVIISSMLFGLVWPLIPLMLPARKLGRWIFGHPPLSAVEREIEHRRMADRIAGLERELKIK
jgi:hypothetical protein